MKVVFNTNSAFLQKNLPFLTQVMLGEWASSAAPTRPGYAPRFSFLPQPLVEVGKAQKKAYLYQEAGVQALPQPTAIPQAFSNQNFLSEFISNLINVFLGLLMLGAAAVLIVFYAPDLYYSVFAPNQPQNQNQAAVIKEAEKANALEGEVDVADQAQLDSQQQEPPMTRYLPEQNPNLPEGDWLIIPLIGVNTALQRTPTAEEALATGVWWVPDFGLPGDLTKPMIASGHRFGWQWWWKSDYWRYHSFYRLPELQPGDLIEIISDQRKWVYEVYAGEEGTEITDYRADLILYTCKFLNSPVRIFRYAKLVKNQN